MNMNSIEEHLPPAYQHCSLQPCSMYFLLSLTLIFKVKWNIKSSLSSSWCYSHFVTTHTRISNWTHRSHLFWKSSFGAKITPASGPEQQDYQEKKNQVSLGRTILQIQYQLVTEISWDLTKLKSKSRRLEHLLVTAVPGVPGIRGAWGKVELGNTPPHQSQSLSPRLTFLHVVKQRTDSNVLRLLPVSDVPLVSCTVGRRLPAF